MQGISVAVISEERDRLQLLQDLVENTNLGRMVFAHLGLPVGSSDPVIRQLQELGAEVVLLDIQPAWPERAVHAIDLILSSMAEVAVFACGEVAQPSVIVSAMRAGAREYIGRSSEREALLEGLARFAAARSRNKTSSGKAKIFHFVNSKAGSGATTMAVNTAMALQEAYGRVVLVDLAPIGHAGLHLNLRPAFGVLDALQNLHRMDASLLEGLMTVHKSGLHLLAGMQQPSSVPPNAAEIVRLFDLLSRSYSFVVVDCSSRMDMTARAVSGLATATLLVTQTDVVSLWSATRLHAFLEEGSAHGRCGLLLNRYKKIPGLTDRDIEKATTARVLWKVPNNYPRVAPAVDKGVPVVLNNNNEVSRSLLDLAAALAQANPSPAGAIELSAETLTPDGRKRPAGPLIISPLRAGH
jgi:pilus assembly protein CpaE